ncbi:hypothetical protein PRZ48_000973 [Zasmidium cellare]|uniref:Uncharacterized protein n=1 Tax=Zasmidium cellare TaxID=395010 RepID=A0ABR0F1L7_ZASCE|nr:hypothetical protein PRZ48_000973 [Zasmidium cellare]
MSRRTELTNFERWCQFRFKEAHRLLTDDAYAAEDRFMELLTEPRIPMWMRVQCNAVLASITDRADDAENYIEDARHVLDLFAEDRPDPDPLGEKIVNMAKRLDEIEKEIEERRQHPWDEDENADETSGKNQDAYVPDSEEKKTEDGQEQEDKPDPANSTLRPEGSPDAGQSKSRMRSLSPASMTSQQHTKPCAKVSPQPLSRASTSGDGAKTVDTP